MKYGVAFIPTIGRLNSFKEAFARTVGKTQLNQVSKIEVSFDPFTGKAAESIRSFAFHVNTSRIRSTNYKCAFKLNVLSDRSEPRMSVLFNNGDKVLFKTPRLNAKEIAEEFNMLCQIHQEKADQASQKKK